MLGSPNLAGKALTGRANQMVKNLPAMPETWVQSLGGEDALEEEMATHSRILAWEIPGRRSLAGCSPQGLKESGTSEATEQKSSARLESSFLGTAEMARAQRAGAVFSESLPRAPRSTDTR